MALTGAVANFTFTAANARDGLVPFLNSVTLSPSSSTVLVSLPTGTVRRGTGALNPSPGLIILLQGQGKDGAGGTTLNLEKQNLDLRSTLGANGRIEFHRMRMTNVRALLHRHGCCYAPVRCNTSVCAGLCGISLLPRGGASWSTLATCCGLFVSLLAWVASRLAVWARTRTIGHKCAHSRARTQVWRRYGCCAHERTR